MVDVRGVVFRIKELSGAYRRSLDFKELSKSVGGGLGCNLYLYYSPDCQAVFDIFIVVGCGVSLVIPHEKIEAIRARLTNAHSKAGENAGSSDALRRILRPLPRPRFDKGDTCDAGGHYKSCMEFKRAFGVVFQ